MIVLLVKGFRENVPLLLSESNGKATMQLLLYGRGAPAPTLLGRITVTFDPETSDDARPRVTEDFQFNGDDDSTWRYTIDYGLVSKTYGLGRDTLTPYADTPAQKGVGVHPIRFKHTAYGHIWWRRYRCFRHRGGVGAGVYMQCRVCCREADCRRRITGPHC